ncbi:branched-chain amino acid ABC transporter permease [Bradyrhizobium sediminis]|uniref:Branched-chain amino acid ABC transporter permease n=1 Tax=Bradyrhizobium sediminis TaxID=2840469 RepID=A0A975NVJ4_9BRAD|nr:branched-chain amino acid ABC transporter permease [Bradyrhizobium sediminis]QWG22173.1 branched-chain amino acid ABC transporter permease [Bradyrhizobium sediminis]
MTDLTTKPAMIRMFGSEMNVRSLLLCGVLVVALILLPQVLVGRPFELRLLTIIFLYATMGQAWNILGGYAGQTSIGHGLFFGLGAYTSTIAVLSLGLNPWLGGLLAIIVAVGAGVLIGLPTFRLKSHYFVIATLVVAESTFLIFSQWSFVGGAIGLELPILPSGWLNFQFHRNKAPYYYIALALLVIVTLFVVWMERSKIGHVLQAIRDDEDAARSLGFSPLRYKLIAMAVSAGVLGFCGTFYAQYVLLVDPPSLLAGSISVIIALIAIFGGIGTVAGPIVGSVVLISLSEYSRIYFSGSGRNIDLLIYGALIMIIAAYCPGGVIGLVKRIRRRIGNPSIDVASKQPPNVKLT